MNDGPFDIPAKEAISRKRFLKRLLLIVALSMFSVAGGCKESPWQLWNSYSARFIDPQSGRVFDPNGDQHTTSEGQAYALFFALADNDRPTFNRVLAWTEANLASADLANPPSGVALGEEQRRPMEGSGPQLGL